MYIKKTVSSGRTYLYLADVQFDNDGRKHEVIIFRVTKSCLQLRPVFLQTDEHTIGHCTVCILALMILKLLQYKLRQQGIFVSIEKIQYCLEKANVVAMPMGPQGDKLRVIYARLSDHTLNTVGERKTKAPDQAMQSTKLLESLMVILGCSPLSYLETENSLRHKLRVDSALPLLNSRQRARLIRAHYTPSSS